MNVILLSHSPNPEKTIACAAKLCYSKSTIDNLYDGLTEESSQDFVAMLSNIGHESPIEHVNFTFGISGVSRAFLSQMTRHRLASYSVQSQRYVKKDKLQIVIPPEIANNKEALNLYNNTMDDILNAYNNITDILNKVHFDSYINDGIEEKKAKSMAEKKAIEDARYVLPNACDTQMVVTMNARSLMNFFKHRCCERAQWEIRIVAEEMLKEVIKVAPTLFANAGPSCYKKACSEGKMTCGKAVQVREYYKNLHNQQD